MKTNLREFIEEDNCQAFDIAMECYNLEKIIDDQYVKLQQTYPLYAIGLERDWRIALESNDEEVNSNKQHILEKLWNFIIKMLMNVRSAIVKFLTGVDVAQEEKIVKQTEDILKNKQNNNIDFANDVVKALSANHLTVISAIEEEKEFVILHNENIALDRKVIVPSSISNLRDFEKNEELVDNIKINLVTLNKFIDEASAKEASERDKALLHALTSGFSISGSENGAYLKSFTSNQDSEKKYERLTKLAEELKREFASDDKVAMMKKVAITLSQQFTLEAKVVEAYLKLNKAIIGVNNKIYAGYNK